MEKPNAARLRQVMVRYGLTSTDISVMLDGRPMQTIRGWLAEHSGGDVPRDTRRLIELLAPSYAEIKRNVKRRLRSENS